MSLYPVNDRWLRIVGLSLIMVLYLITAGADIFSQSLTSRGFLRVCLSFGIIFAYWHALRALIIAVRQRYPTKAQAGKRIVLTFLAGMVVTAILSWCSALLRYAFWQGTLVGFANTDQPRQFYAQ